MKLNSSNILVINGGSSSIKFAMYGMDEHPNKIISGQIKRIGLDDVSFTVLNKISGKQTELKIDSTNFKQATEFLIEFLRKQELINEVVCIGHRIVHGMEHTHPEIIDDSLLKFLNKIIDYDPEHLPAEVEIVELFKKQFPGLLQVACFDTSFHTTMPRVAKILPIPRHFDKEGIRRYGFHGLSFAHLLEKLKTIGGTSKGNGRIILAHLGNGASLAAVKDGSSLDTSMGFTPAGGLVMSTRTGDLDPGVAWYMMANKKLTAQQFNHLINHESGLKGVSETSSDMQDLLKNEGSDIRASEAVALFCYQVRKWIGAFAAVLNGLDIMVFSGGIGENAPVIRSRICQEFDYLGIEINEIENDKNSSIISKVTSKVIVYVIPTDEEFMIAKETKKLYTNAKNTVQ